MKAKTKFKETEIGLIPNDWEVKDLDIVIDIKHGFAFKGEFLSEDPNEHVVLTPGNFNIGGGFKSHKFKYYRSEYPDEYILNKDDIVVSMTDLSKAGDTLGYAAKIPPSDEARYLHNQRLGLVQFKSGDVDPDFIHWLLRTRKYQQFIVGSATGSTVKHTSPTRIKEYVFAFPPIDEQKSISKILTDIESKLEFCLNQTKVLEKMGKAIFRKELIDLDVISEDWEEVALDNIANFLNGLALQKYPQKGEEFLPVIKIRELKQGITKNTERADTKIPQKYIINDGDILFSWSGSLEVVIWCDGKGALNQHLFKVTSDQYPKWFYYYWTLYHLSQFKRIAEDKATTMGHIKRKHLSEAMINLPPTQKINELDKIMTPLIEKQILLRVQARKLGKLRDLLLPRLMSGRIRVEL